MMGSGLALNVAKSESRLTLARLQERGRSFSMNHRGMGFLLDIASL